MNENQNSQLRNLMESTMKEEQKALFEYGHKLAAKWEPTGLLEGIDSDLEKNNLAILIENQARQLIKEANGTGTSANSEEWSGVALPLVRRVFGEISAKEFVSVQPLRLPSGLVFWLDFKYSTNQAGFVTGSGRTSQEDSIWGVTDATKGTAAPKGGLYGSGRFGYTINDVSSVITATGSIAAPTSAIAKINATITDADFNFNSEFSASKASVGKLYKVLVATSSLTTPDLEGIRAFTIEGASIGEVYPEFTTINSNNSIITFLVSGSADYATDMAAAEALNVKYHKQPTDITRGDFEDSNPTAYSHTNNALDIPTMDLQMRSEPIVAKTRKLKAVWTPEFAQDLNAYHSIDAEAELTSMLSEYISMEVDLEILDMLIQNAQTTDYWSARIGYEWDAASSAFVAGSSNAYFNQQDWFQTLGTTVQSVSNEIFRLTLRGGGANFLVCGPRIATILESIPGYSSNASGDQNKFAMGVNKVGMLNNRWNVYKNPYMVENIILVGYRGSQFLETGAVYSPYVPLISTPLVYDPDNFTPRKGVMTRYAKKITRPEFYGKVYVKDVSRY